MRLARIERTLPFEKLKNTSRENKATLKELLKVLERAEKETDKKFTLYKESPEDYEKERMFDHAHMIEESARNDVSNFVAKITGLDQFTVALMTGIKHRNTLKELTGGKR